MTITACITIRQLSTGGAAVRFGCPAGNGAARPGRSGKSTIAADALQILIRAGWFAGVVRMDAANPGSQTAAVRTVDVTADPRMRSLLSDKTRLDTLTVGDLEPATCRPHWRKYGVDIAGLPTTTLDLLPDLCI
jgi:hypothetical protein